MLKLELQTPSAKALAVMAVSVSALLSGCLSAPSLYTTDTIEESATDNFLRPAAVPLANASTPLSLKDAQVRTLSYNSEYARQERQFIEAIRLSGQRGKDFLPRTYLNSFGTWRSNANAAIGSKLDEPSDAVPKDFYTGQDQAYAISNLTATWDLLEIGMSGLRANRRTLSAFNQGEQNQYLCNKLMVDVEQAYWRAVAYEQAAKRAVWLKQRIEFALKLSEQRIEDNPDSRLSELMFQREIIDINRWYESIFRGVTSAKADLARLMNLPLGTEFTLSENHLPQDLGETAKADVLTLVKIAYKNRPEIRQALYAKDMIDVNNKETLWSHLPALRVFFGGNTDSNSFLLNSSFASAGLNLSWDLLRLGQIGETKKRGKISLQDRKRETEVLASAVMAQVMIARQHVELLDNDLTLASKALTVQGKITNSLQKSVETEDKPETYLVKEELMRELVTLRENLARADLYGAKARLDQSIGIVNMCSTQAKKPLTHQNPIITSYKTKVNMPGPIQNALPVKQMKPTLARFEARPKKRARLTSLRSRRQY